VNDLTVDFVFACILYVVLLVVIGAFARQARRDSTLSDMFLAGRTLGFGVLLLTLFATQFSGNSFSGFPAQVYREGLAYSMGVMFTVGVATGYLLFAPRLYRIARQQRFVTPTDYLRYRFGSPILSYVATGIFILALTNFLLAQLTALGQAFFTFTDGDIPYWLVVVLGGIVVLVYQVMGGFRAVAWTDVFQGVLIMVGLVLVVVMLWAEVGSPAAITKTVALLRPDLAATPDLRTCFIWLSNFLLLALGSPLYPQALQRVYAARRVPDLKRVIAILALIPLFTGSAVVLIGAAGIALFPQQGLFASDEVTFRVIAHLMESNALTYYPVLVVMVAIVAAIMSTADSCLLSVSSMLTKDVAAQRKGLSAEQAERYTRLAPWFSIIVMAVVVGLAMRPLTTLWGLLVIKFEILIQLSPAFVLGTLHDPDDARGVTVREVMAGLVTGLVVTLAIYMSSWESLYGLHAGTVGVLANYIVVAGSRWVRLQRNRPLTAGLTTLSAARRNRAAVGGAASSPRLVGE
jgi:Na+/proline symporter